MSQIPEVRSARFFEKNWVVELVAAFPPVIAVVVTAVATLIDERVGNNVLGYVLLGSALWMIVASFLRVANAYSEDKAKAEELGYDGLRSALHVVHSSVSDHENFSKEERSDGRLRVTILRVVPPADPSSDPEETEQLLSYVGGQGKGPGRRFSVRSGIVGKSVRERNPIRASRQNDDYEQFVDELVSEWSYTREDAQALSHDRRAWMAVPILGTESDVVAVVFLDSYDRELFNEDVTQLIISMCGGVARYVDERYR